MEKPRKNTDPITGEPGGHPVGTGVGAAGGAVTGAALGAAISGPIGAAVGTVVGGIAAAYGAHGVAEAMNPTTQEEKYWRVGVSHRLRRVSQISRGKAYEEIEGDLALDYDRNKAGSALPWDHARHAVHAAWAKLSHDIGPRDPDRGTRSGM